MRTFALICAGAYLLPAMLQAETRTWKNRKGDEIKAEMTGVKDGKVVLKTPARRIYVRLSELSLADRDYVAESLTKRNSQRDRQQLLELMLAENKVPVIDPDRPPASTNESSDSYQPDYAGGIRSPLTGIPRPGNPLTGNPAAEPPPAETEMYGLPLPSPELLVEDKVRAWTSLAGQTQLATFDRVLAPGFLRLKKADGSSGTFALVNFKKEDIEYIKRVLQEDMARPVFPEGSGFQSLTPDDVSKGYKVWTDRRDVTLIGKFAGVKGKNVVIEVAGEEKEYPKAGLSEVDRSWVDAEIRRRAEEARAKAEQQARAASSSSGYSGGSSPFNRSPFGNRSSFGPGGHSDSSMSRFGNSGSNYGSGGHSDGSGSQSGRSPFGGLGMPQYKFNCDHCGRSWTDSVPLSHCPNCKDKYHFRCHRCGHKWTRTGTMIDQCPKCSASGGNGSGSSGGGHSSSFNNRSSDYSFDSDSSSSDSSTSSSAASDKSESGVLMTLVYVGIGLSILGGIAGGLFKAFG